MNTFDIIMMSIITLGFVFYHLAVRKFKLTEEVTLAEDTTIYSYKNIA